MIKTSNQSSEDTEKAYKHMGNLMKKSKQYILAMNTGDLTGFRMIIL